MPHYRRDAVIQSSEENRIKLWEWLATPDANNPKIDRAWERALGCYYIKPRNLEGIFMGHWGPAVEIHSVRTTRRSGPDGQDVRQLIVEVTQRRRGYLDAKKQKQVDAGKVPRGRHDFVFRGGATLIIDLRENKLRYVVRKRIDDDDRLCQQRDLLSLPEGFGFTYLGDRGTDEPFAVTHRGQ